MKKISMSNLDIYNTALGLRDNFNLKRDLYIPAIVNFTIQKNLSTFLRLAEDIEKVRNDIGEKYGRLDESGQSFYVLPENRDMANRELSQLMRLEQTVEIRTIDIRDLQDLKLNSEQMQTLMFMIEESLPIE